MLIRLSYRLADHTLTRPLGLMLHFVLHSHKADDDCLGCQDDLR